MNKGKANLIYWSFFSDKTLHFSQLPPSVYHNFYILLDLRPK